MWANNRYLEQLDLGDAVATQGVQLVSRLLDLKSNMINEPGAGGLTPLHRACARGSAELVQLLISRGADLENESEAKETPIHYACKRGNTFAIDALIKAGAKVDSLDMNGKTILHQASQGGSIYALLYLESVAPQLRMDVCDSSGRSLLHYACLQGHKDLVRFLLKRSRCPIDLVDDKGNTCLHLVASTPREDIAWILVMEGGFKLLSTKNNDGDTPLAISQKQNTGDPRFRGMQNFFRICQYASSTAQLTSQSYGIRLFLLFAPFCIFLAAILGAKRYPNWSSLIFAMGVFFTLLCVRLQSHRTMDPSRKPNPVFLGAYAAGVAHTLICFYFDVLPYVRSTWIPSIALLLTPFHLLIYISLLIGDPGSVSNGEDVGNQSSDNYCEVLRRGALSLRDGVTATDVYCIFCEKALRSPTIKHCKLCRRCYSDLDHHCLFLMTCIAKKNHRRFIWLIVLSVMGIAIFLWSAYIKFQFTCGVNVSPVAFVACVLQRAPWTAAAVFFNSGSFIWGLYMVTYSLRALSEGGTVYFRVGKSNRPSYVTRFLNIFCFLVCGRYYRHADFRDLEKFKHSHGV